MKRARTYFWPTCQCRLSHCPNHQFSRNDPRPIQGRELSFRCLLNDSVPICEIYTNQINSVTFKSLCLPSMSCGSLDEDNPSLEFHVANLRKKILTNKLFRKKCSVNGSFLKSSFSHHYNILLFYYSYKYNNVM